MKILIIPEYGNVGSGTFSVLSRLLEIHRKNKIKSAILIEESQQIPEIMAYSKKLDLIVYTGKNRSRLFCRALFSSIYDIFFCLRAFRLFKPDLIVVSNGTPGFMVGTLLFPAPVMFLMHTYPMTTLRLPIRLLCRFASKRGKRFVTVSHFSAERIKRCMGVPGDRIEVIYNSFKSGITDSKKATKHPIILTIGHVVDYKNPECWLEVAKKIVAHKSDIRFVWLGDGELLKTMRRLVDDMGLSDNIQFKGYTDNVEEHYRNAIVYFQPSLIENHSIAVIEAMAHGLPCVTSNIGGLPESIIDEETGFLCEPHDIDDYIAKIVDLLDNSELRNEMGYLGRRRAENLFSQDVQEKKIVDLYNSMLHKAN